MGLFIQALCLSYVAVTCFSVVSGFTDETVEKAVKSEGYCSRILRAQGSTRKEGYHEFSLRVEGDPEYYKPGSTYRGKWRDWHCIGGREGRLLLRLFSLSVFLLKLPCQCVVCSACNPGFDCLSVGLEYQSHASEDPPKVRDFTYYFPGTLCC